MRAFFFNNVLEQTAFTPEEKGVKQGEQGVCPEMIFGKEYEH